MKQHLHMFELGACGCVPSTVWLVQRVAIRGLSGSEGSFPGCPRVLRPSAQSPLLRATCKADEGTLPGCSPALGAPGEVDAGWWHLHLLPVAGVQP